MASDQELWLQICKADTIAFEAFYRLNAPRLLAFLCQAVGNRQSAEDIMQETFTQIWRRPNGFQPERGTLRGYLYGIARKRAAEWWRQQKPRDFTAPNEAVASRTESAWAMADALAHLPEEQRALLWLREVEGQHYAELAEIFEIPVGTVRSRLFVAREALRKIWHGPQLHMKEEL